MTVYEKCFQHIVRAEGSYVDNPLDRLGATKYGVTLETLRDYHHNPLLSNIDVANLTLAQASDIYFNKYWKPLGLEDCYNDQACVAIFDQAVNRGVQTVLAQLHQILGFKISPSYTTYSAILNFYYDCRNFPRTADKDNVADRHLGFMIDFLSRSTESYVAIVEKNPTQLVFLRGWLNRVNNLYAMLVNPVI